MRTKHVRSHKLLILLGLFLPLFGQTVRYAVILNDPPLAAGVSNGRELKALANSATARRIETAQAAVRESAKTRGAEVLHSTKTLLNAVCVKATREQAAALGSIPGVAKVVEVPSYKRHMTAAL